MIKKGNLRLLLLDIRYAVISWRFLLGIVLGAAICFFTLLFCGDYQSETIHKYILLHDRAQSFLAYIIGILPSALAFYDDIAHSNMRNIVGRIKLRNYIFSKTIMAFLTTILAFTCGKMLFVTLHSIYNAVCLPESFSKLPDSLLYLDLAKEGHYLLYFLLSSLHKSFYCAVLCQIVMLFSICIQNVSVIFSIPIAIFYVVHFYINNKIQLEYLNLSKVFDGATRIWPLDIQNFLYALFIMFVCGFLVYRMTLKIFERKMYHE